MSNIIKTPKTTDELTLDSLTKSLEVKSLKDLVRVKQTENSFLLIDCSGSMSEKMRNGRERISGLREVVSQVQSQKQVPMVAFGPRMVEGKPVTYDMIYSGEADRLQALPWGFVTEVPDPGGNTPLKEAIEFARVQGAGRLVVISDGEPGDPQGCMEAARMFGGRIDVIFVGDEGDMGSIFLERLAESTGGQRYQGDLTDPKMLSGAVVGLLMGEVLETVGDDEPDVDEDDEDDDDDDDDDDDI